MVYDEFSGFSGSYDLKKPLCRFTDGLLPPEYNVGRILIPSGRGSGVVRASRDTIFFFFLHCL